MTEKKLLIVSSEFPPQPGGIGNHAFNLASQFSKNGFTVGVIADKRSDDGVEEQEFDAQQEFAIYRVNVAKPRFPMYVKRLWKIYRQINKADYVIATGKFSLWGAALCSLFYKRHYFAVIHGTEVNFKKKWLKKSIEVSLKQFQIVIAVSNYTKSLVDHLNLNVTVIPNGINLQKWGGVFPNRPINLKGNPKLVTVGNVSSRKGQQNVIRHLPKLLKQFPDLHYHCLGLPTEVVKFSNLAAELGVEEHVSFHGRVGDVELKRMLIASDIFVMLSSQTSSGDVEGFGIAILEANAIGLPAIGSLGCGIEDAIKNEYNGLLISPDNFQMFSKAIETILKDQSYRDNALNWANQHDWSKVISLYEEKLK